MVYALSFIGLLFVFIPVMSTKFDKMKVEMLHPNGDNLFSFLAGIITWGITSLTLTLLNANIPAWVPPLISVFSAFAGGFVGMWGKDVYKAWKARRVNKH